MFAFYSNTRKCLLMIFSVEQFEHYIFINTSSYAHWKGVYIQHATVPFKLGCFTDMGDVLLLQFVIAVIYTMGG